MKYSSGNISDKEGGSRAVFTSARYDVFFSAFKIFARDNEVGVVVKNMLSQKPAKFRNFRSYFSILAYIFRDRLTGGHFERFTLSVEEAKENHFKTTKMG